MKTSANEKFVITNLTDVGMVRESNQDYYGKYSGSFGELLIVCDGMGGYSGGEVASQIAVETISAHFQSLSATFSEVNELQRALGLAQQNIAHHAGENPELAEMGTTAVILLVRESNYWIAWIGDSRIYRRRGTKTEQLSKDHSWVQGMVDQGLIKPEDANSHPRKNIILRSLGAEPHASEASGPFPLYRNDVFMLCSDGLSDYFSLEEVNQYLAQEPQAACRGLVDEAKRRGGKDNITIQILKVNQGAVYKPAPSEGGYNLLTLILAFLALGLLVAGVTSTLVNDHGFLFPKKAVSPSEKGSDFVIKDTTGAKRNTTEHKEDPTLVPQPDKPTSTGKPPPQSKTKQSKPNPKPNPGGKI